MRANDLVGVRPAWNAWQMTYVPVDQLRNARWLQPDGAPRRILHASVARTGTVVCVLKHDCVGSVYRELARQADAGIASCAALPRPASAAALP